MRDLKANEELPEEVRHLLALLWRSDREMDGRPQLPPSQTAQAQEWLTRILVESDPLLAHLALLENLSGAKVKLPLPRFFRLENEPPPSSELASGFRHNQPLPPERARAVTEQGPAALTEEELACLLLNPVALCDLGDLICTLMPRYWWGHLDQAGRRMMEQYHLEVPIPGHVPGTSER